MIIENETRPIEKLMTAMGEFEKDAAGFSYEPVRGSNEINSLSSLMTDEF